MAGRRFTIVCFVPEDVYQALPSATKLAIRDRIRQLKGISQNIGEEFTTRAKWHICRHDEGGACDPELDI